MSDIMNELAESTHTMKEALRFLERLIADEDVKEAMHNHEQEALKYHAHSIRTQIVLNEDAILTAKR
jgi:transposase